MKISTENNGEYGWFPGYLQLDSSRFGRDSYRLSQEGMRSAEISGSQLMDSVYSDVVSEGGLVILAGELEVGRRLTGGFNFQLEGVDAAAAVIEEDYQGWTVGVSGYDLVFTGEKGYRVEEAGSLEELDEIMDSWFDNPEGYLDGVERFENEMDDWLWKD